MRIYRRPGSKVWQVYWKGQRRSLGVTDREAAERAFVAMQRRSVDPTYRPPDGATLAEELKAFGAEKSEKGRAAGTIKMYQTHSRHLCAVLGADTPLHEIDAEAVDRYVSRRTKDGADKSTRWKELCTLRGVLKRARRQRRYPFALDEVMPPDLQPKYVPLTRHILLPDVARLLSELSQPRRAAVAFIVAFGADLGCLWRAEPGDVDVRAGVARVRGSKTAHRDRVVPIVPPFEALAKEAAAGIPFAPWASIRRDLMRAATRAEVGPPDRTGKGRHITARDLRRSHGRILREAGVAPHLIAPMLGHAPGSPVTALTYAQIAPAELGAQIAAAMAPTRRPRRKAPAKKKRKRRAT